MHANKSHWEYIEIVPVEELERFLSSGNEVDLTTREVLVDEVQVFFRMIYYY